LWDERGDLHRRSAGLCNRYHRQVAILNVLAFGARPFLHGRSGTGVGYLGLQGNLGLDRLGGLRVHKFILFIEQFQFFKAPVEFNDDEREDNDEEDPCQAALSTDIRSSPLSDISNSPPV